MMKPLTYQNVPNEFVTSKKNTQFAYRILGQDNNKILLLLTHLAATMDNWDPKLINTLSEKYRVIVFDNKGVGLSKGKVPNTIEEMAEGVLEFIDAMQLNAINVLGLSMGGMVAQELVKIAFEKIDKLILVGTGPRGGEGIEKIIPIANKLTFKAILNAKDPKYYLFFNQDDIGKTKATEYLKRLKERKINRDKKITLPSYIKQLKAIKKWGKANREALNYIDMPTLIVNGDNDKMVPTQNSFVLADEISYSELKIYQNAGHGSLFQEPIDFCESVNEFIGE
ncbi:alpha/beta fold hydrolase [Staphylococcus succinus]|uniref:alpha/beta fold hydrolase n=1 Tax=Staphylococcus succinus TaxID=61015 RepID=UPI001C716B89|nr:alpha/beta hydrolase [Staphylococcus succinus]